MFDGKHIFASLFASVFNPPPLTTLSQLQKIARIFIVALSLFVLCVIAATLGTLALFLVCHASAMANDQPTMSGLEIVLLAALVNTLCLRAILAIKRSA